MLFVSPSRQKGSKLPNKKEWEAFAEYISDTLACFVRFLPDVNQPRGDLVQNMDKLNV